MEVKERLPAKKCSCQWLAKDTWPLLFSVWEAHRNKGNGRGAAR